MAVEIRPEWEPFSREVAMDCDAAGYVTWSDARAERLLGASPGVAFASLSVPGTEEKALALLTEGCSRQVPGWEIPLVALGAPATFSFVARPKDGGVALYGFLVPDGYGTVVDQLKDALAEVVALNRTITRQKKHADEQTSQLRRAYVQLDESNRGILTLHAELADKADTLRRTSDVKSRVVANVSHEFRTPLHTILGLSKLLLEASDGPLTGEQQKQLQFIRTAAEELYALVNDMLDLSKAESGKAIVRPERFSASEFLASMRGMMRPLIVESDVELVFEAAPEGLELHTDRGKIAQILRNLISNALKFTETGEVRVRISEYEGRVFVRVTDTGIGIAPENYDRIFEEFGQIDSPLQHKVKGTGLGLPLSKKLAELLGGSLTVDSEVDKGSTFTLSIPKAHPEAVEMERLEARPLDPTKAPVLVVEDDRKTIFLYERYLALAGFQVVPARNTDAARKVLQAVKPAAIVLDIMLEGESSWEFLAELKRNPETNDIPVLVVTVTNKEQRARALGADEFWLKPVDQDRLLRRLKPLARPGNVVKVLVIDDDEKARYLLRKVLQSSPYGLLEADTGTAGVIAARQHQPDVILLDFLLQGTTAFDVLDELKADPRTRTIPVIIVTSHVLEPVQRDRLAAETEAILSKDGLSRELAINRIRDALTKAGVRGANRGVEHG